MGTTSDIDLIGQERFSEYHSAPPLISLLNEMDGIVDATGIVTVATTNGLETLDKALSERPSRFDRIIQIPLPKDELRLALVESLTKTIPLNDQTKETLVQKTKGFSPAQIQETIFSMVIAGVESAGEIGTLELTRDNVDLALGFLRPSKSTKTIGFNTIPYGFPVEGGQLNNNKVNGER